MIRKQAIIFLALFHLAANAGIHSSVVADVTDGLIGHWKLDEMSYDGTAGEVVDSSGNGNHGFTLGLPKTNPGVNGRSLVIDSRWGISKNPMAVIPHTDSLTLSGDFTVCLWVYPLHNGSSLIAKRTNAAGSEFDIALSASSGQIAVYSAGVIREFITTSLLNKWSYLTVCRSNTYFSVYVNGVNYGTSDSVFTPLGCSAEIGIGAVRYVPSGRYAATSGNYDDVRLYNRALTGDEIKKLYAVTQKQRESYASVSRDIPYENLPANGLIVHWKLDELSYDGTEGEVTDSSGNGNHGVSYKKVITNPGKNKRAAYFDGSGASIYRNIYLPTNNTMSGWVKILRPIHDSLLFGHGSGVWPEYSFYVGTAPNRLLFKRYDYVSNPEGVNGGVITVVDGVDTHTWYFLAVTSTNFISTVYVNGIYVGSVNYKTYEFALSGFSIGSFMNWNWKAGESIVDDVRIYNRALSPEEIAQIYKAKPLKEGIAAVYSGNRLVSNPEKKDYPNTVSENIEPVEPVTLTFEYVSTYPATITIGGTAYGQPADPSKALVDAGDGVFVQWTSNTITVKGKRIRFRGDWRNSSGNFRDLFNGTFAGGYNVTMSGGFDFEGAPADYMFNSTFTGCSNLTGSIPVGLFGNISGAPAASMFDSTFTGCSSLTGSIPVGLFGNISGAPRRTMFYGTFYGCSNLTGSIPVGLFGAISGAPVAHMFTVTFGNCSKLTGSIPSGLFGNISGAPAPSMFDSTFTGCSSLTGSIPSGLFGAISGAPAEYMFNATLKGCSNLTGSIPVGLFGDISGTPAASMFYGTFYGCSNLTGESALMPDGTTHLYEQFPTASGTQCDNCYLQATGLDDYATMPAAWK